jgi:8-oxo-dGTP diphosphatase
MPVNPEEQPARRTRVAAYAVVVREEQILLSRLAPYLSETERWTLPGGGVEFGEHPRDAVVREVHEETGLDVTVSDEAWVDSALIPARVGSGDDEPERHAIRLLYDGWVAADAAEPRVLEVDGSTVDAAWHPVADVLSGAVPTVPVVQRALARHRTFQLQRPAAYALVRRGGEVLLTRISARGAHTGRWGLPGGGIDFGEAPVDAVRREVHEETGLDVEVGALLGVHDVHFGGIAPSGRYEDFHGIHLVFAGTVAGDAEPRVVEEDGTTDAVAWVPLAEIASGEVPVLDVVKAALAF